MHMYVMRDFTSTSQYVKELHVTSVLHIAKVIAH